MRKRVSKKDSWFKGNSLTEKDDIYVGVDVHKVNYHVAIWHNGRIGCVYSMSSDNSRLLQDLQQIRSSLKGIVYEAGPTGYGLARLLRSADLPAEVVAATKTLRMTDSAAKTDRLDCEQLAEYAAKGLYQGFADGQDRSSETARSSRCRAEKVLEWSHDLWQNRQKSRRRSSAEGHLGNPGLQYPWVLVSFFRPFVNCPTG